MDKQKDFEKGWEEYKAKKKQETEKMIGIIQNAVGGCARNWASLIAEELHKNRYRKIKKNAVMLTEEELDNIKNAKYCSGLIAGQEQGSKETAEKLLDEIDYESNGQTKSITDLLRKKYGV